MIKKNAPNKESSPEKEIIESYITGSGTGIPGITSPFYTVTKYSDESTITKGPFFSIKDAEK